MQLKLVSALESKKQLIPFRVYGKVQQVHKRTETDNDGRKVIHWFNKQAHFNKETDERFRNILHQFDPCHVRKSILKKILKASQKKGYKFFHITT